MRRFLLLPAAALVLLGAPVLALQQPAPADAPPTAQEVPVPEAEQPVSPGFQREVAVPDASLVGVTWTGDPTASFTVEAKDASGAWQPARQVDAADVIPDDRTADAQRAGSKPREGSEPIWVGDATAVRVRLDDGTAADVKVAAIDSTPGQLAPPGSAGALTDWLPRVDGPNRYAFAGALLGAALLLGALALGWSPWRRRRSRTALLAVMAALTVVACQPVPLFPATRAPTVVAIAQPLITMRTTWGAASPVCTNPNTNVVFAVVHHTVNSNDYTASESASMVRAIQAYHMNTLGYCDIAYNFLIDRFGKIYEGRGGGITQGVLGAHTGGFNTSSTGVALIGDYRAAPVPQAQWSALVQLLQWKLSIHGSDATSPFTTISNGGGSRFPAGQQVTFPYRILGHTDLWPTECPGADVQSRLAELRAAVEAGLAPPTTTTTAAAAATNTER